MTPFAARLCTCDPCLFARGRYRVRPYPCNNSPKQVAIGLLQDGKRSLIGLRPKDRPLPDLWELPGGKAMPGESLHEALVREWNEELGLQIVVGEFLWSDVFDFPDGFFEVSLFRVATAPGVTPTPKVHQQLRFATAAQIQELPVIDSMFYIIGSL